MTLNLRQFGGQMSLMAEPALTVEHIVPRNTAAKHDLQQMANEDRKIRNTKVWDGSDAEDFLIHHEASKLTDRIANYANAAGVQHRLPGI